MLIITLIMSINYKEHMKLKSLEKSSSSFKNTLELLTMLKDSD